MKEFLLINQGVWVVMCLVMPGITAVLTVAYLLALRRDRRRGDDAEAGAGDRSGESR